MIVAGKLDESVLWDLVLNDEMPPRPEEPLSAAEKTILRRWIEQGAKICLPPQRFVASHQPPITGRLASNNRIRPFRE